MRRAFWVIDESLGKWYDAKIRWALGFRIQSHGQIGFHGAVLRICRPRVHGVQDPKQVIVRLPMV